MEKFLEWARELQSLSQAGLYYCHDKFCRERYRRIREISAEILSERTDLPRDKVKNFFCCEVGYQTPKIDTRAAIFDGEKILLVRETNGKWVLPGGWCEVNLSPAENVVKEVREEAGLDVVVEKIIAVQDRDKHNRPPHIYGVTKIFFLCRSNGGEFVPNLETTSREYFAQDNLPALENSKCNAAQIELCFAANRADVWETQFD